MVATALRQNTLRHWQGLLVAAVVWVLAFFLFSQQGLWASVLGSIFPNASPVLFERATLLTLVLQHLQISFTSMIIVILVGIPLAIFCTRRQGLAFLPLVENIVAVGQTFPPVAVLFLSLPIFGFGTLAPILALFFYGLLPTVRGTLLGLGAVAPELKDAALGSGMNGFQLLRRLELPLALPAILAGLRSSLVLVIATTSIAPLVGTGGLGVPMIGGLTTNNTSLLLQGAIPVAMLALLSDFTLRSVERLLTPWRADRES
jgi:osmoprotectant transport system permease protein